MWIRVNAMYYFIQNGLFTDTCILLASNAEGDCDSIKVFLERLYLTHANCFIHNGLFTDTCLLLAANDQGGYDRIVSSGVIQILEKELLIASTDPKYAGKYVCNATNSKGTALAAAWLTVASK